MSTNGRVRDNEPNVATSFSGLAHDVIELGELQAQLFALDVKRTSLNARGAFVLTVAGASFLLSAISVGLFALAELLVEELEWDKSTADLVTAVVGVALGGGILAAAWRQWQSGISALDRSREELSRNIAWLKSSLRNRPAAQADFNRSDRVDSPSNPR